MSLRLRTPAQLLLAILVEPLHSAESAAILGVAPRDEAKYSGGQFHCFDGQGSPLPAAAVNDEYCDCADGSDEPGTGACAGQTTTVFFCRNEGSTPRHLYASRVGDGLCDCCDGSDEASLAERTGGRTACRNTCAEQGRVEQEATKLRIEELTKALQLKEEIRKKALVERDTYAEEVKRLESELPALEETLNALKVEADKEREIQKQKEEEEKNRTDAATNSVSEACRWRQTGGCEPTGPREENNDKKCSISIAKGSSGFCDCDGDGEKQGAEQGYGCTDAGPGTCAKVCAKSEETSPEAAGQAEEAGDEKPQEAGQAEEAKNKKPEVSEYAKWMDGAAEKLSEEGQATPGAEKLSEEEKPQVSEYTKWMDGAESKMKEEAPAQAAEPTTTTTTTTTVAAKRSAIDEEREAQRNVQRNKDSATEMKTKMTIMSDSHLGYASLVGKTLTKRVSEFNYKINFYSDAIQDSTRLGKWEKWTGPRSATFDKGTMCWGGPERKLNVNFRCGLEEALLDAFEPSRCVYEASVTHPGACEEEDLRSLTAGTRVIAAHEEL